MPSEGLACFSVFISVSCCCSMACLVPLFGVVLVYSGIPFLSSMYQVFLKIIILIIKHKWKFLLYYYLVLR